MSGPGETAERWGGWSEDGRDTDMGLAEAEGGVDVSEVALSEL